jgi:hypothetical protein
MACCGFSPGLTIELEKPLAIALQVSAPLILADPARIVDNEGLVIVKPIKLNMPR